MAWFCVGTSGDIEFGLGQDGNLQMGGTCRHVPQITSLADPPEDYGLLNSARGSWRIVPGDGDDEQVDPMDEGLRSLVRLNRKADHYSITYYASERPGIVVQVILPPERYRGAVEMMRTVLKNEQLHFRIGMSFQGFRVEKPRNQDPAFVSMVRNSKLALLDTVQLLGYGPDPNSSPWPTLKEFLNRKPFLGTSSVTVVIGHHVDRFVGSKWVDPGGARPGERLD